MKCPPPDRRVVSTLAGGVTAFALLLSGCDDPPPAAAPERPPVEVEIVQTETRDLPIEYEFVGRTESSQRVEIRARVAGYLDGIDYTEGEFVEEGDVLFRIDPAPFESQLRAARAELAQQQARLENAQALLNRIEPLAEADAVAEKELDDARGRMLEASAAVEAASARVFDAELNLSYATITSPVRGLTSQASQREGAYISSTTGALTDVVAIDPMWVEFSVTETQMLQGRRSQADGTVRPPEDDQFDVGILLADGREHAEQGRISFADASVSTRTGSVLLRAEIPNPEETLRPGQFVRVLLRGATRPDAIVVPLRAVREGPKGPFLWVVGSDGTAELRPVALGPWQGDYWVVEQGLREGDRVIVNGTVTLAPGTPITISRILDLDDVALKADDSGAGS